MILSKDSNNNWTPTASGNGTFIGTLTAFNAIKDTLPVNTVAYITDDGNGDLQPVDAVTNGDMHPVTSNAVYDTISTIGTVVTNTYAETTQVTTNYYCNVSITLTKGVWAVTLKCDATKSSSMNWGIWAIRGDTYNGGEIAYLTYPARLSGLENCRGSVTAIIDVASSSRVVYGNLYTDSNVTYDNGRCTLTAVRIK